jgi:hypothetical protein
MAGIELFQIALMSTNYSGFNKNGSFGVIVICTDKGIGGIKRFYFNKCGKNSSSDKILLQILKANSHAAMG